jgi:hypothetical protein
MNSPYFGRFLYAFSPFFIYFCAISPPPQVTLCPSFVIGPMLNGATGTLNTSLRVMQDVMKANVPFVPKMGLPLVDVEWQWGFDSGGICGLARAVDWC